MKRLIYYFNHLFLLIVGMSFVGCTQDVAPISVASVTLDTTSITLVEGDAYILTATISPSNADNQLVLWFTSDSTIATVIDGIVVAVNPGTATITAISDDGGKTATCLVTVYANTCPVDGVSLDITTATITEGESLTLTAIFHPSNATNKNVTWKSNNTTVATVVDGEVTALKAGTATITVTTEDGEYSASCSLTVEESYKPSWGLVGTFNNWGNSSNDIPMSSDQNYNYYVATNVSLNKSDSFAFRYNNNWDQSRGGAPTGGNGSTAVVFEETFAGCTGVMGWTGNVATGNFVADNSGWTVENAYGANGAAKFGASSKRGSAQTPALNLTGNATLIFRAGAWSGDQTSLKISMTGGTLSKSSITLSNGSWSEYEISITNATTGAKIKFEGVQSSKARFFLDDIRIVQTAGGDKGTFSVNKRYSTVPYDDECQISVANSGTYDIYLATSLNYFYIMSNGQQPDNIPVTGITLSNTEVSLYVGESTRLTYKIEPTNATNQSVEWESSNPSVATVDNYGKVTAISEGESVITLRAEDGDHTTRCHITVKNINWIDLSADGTANCYVVSDPGAYKFTPTKGCSSESVGKIASVTVLWESFGTDKTPAVGDLIKYVDYDGNDIYFRTPDTWTPGNAVVAALDASGSILWSWHIWITYNPYTYKVTYKYEGEDRTAIVMDRNLGATTWDIDDARSLGLCYQWGRKDPFLSSAYISTNNSKDIAKSTTQWSRVESDSYRGTIEYATQHPTTYIEKYYNENNHNENNYDWYYTGSAAFDDTRWSTSTKTIYDPCPAGWRVPTTFDPCIYNIEHHRVNYSWMGTGFKVEISTSVNVFYPDPYTSVGTEIYSSGGYWTAASDYYDERYAVCSWYGISVYAQSCHERAVAQSVRCVRYQ